MPVFLLFTAAVLIACVGFSKLSNRLGIPVLLAFILLGMAFGSDGLLKIPFDNFYISEQISSIALIFIMFYGGFGTKWSEAAPIAVQAVLLSSLGVMMTAGITGLFCYFALRLPLLESMLIGSVISSTDAASVFSILRSKRLNLKDNTASMLEVESGSNDPTSYMLTVIILSVMSGSASGGKIAYLIFAQVAYGALFGVGIAFAALWGLKRLRLASDGFDAIYIFAVAVFAYALPAALGGNGYLSAYIVGILLGNREFRNKRTLVHFFDGVTGLMQIILFFLLGLLSFPSQLPRVALPALLIALFLTFVARPITVFAILTPFKSSLRQRLLVSWSGLRGAASIVFAVMATVSPASTSTDVFHMVFFIVLFSILLQGSLIPVLSKKLHMIDQDEDVMKTFTDYMEEMPVQFIEFTVPQSHSWTNKRVRSLVMPPDTILVMLERDGKKTIPRGNTMLLSGDKIVLSAMAAGTMEGVSLVERHIGHGDTWENKRVSDLCRKCDMLIVLIQRNGKIVFPRGDTVIKRNDVLVLNHL